MAEIQPHSPGLARVRISMRPKTSFPSLSSIEPSLSSASLFRTWTDSIQRVHIYHTLRRKGVCSSRELLISMTYREWNHHGIGQIISVDRVLIFSIIEVQFVFIKFLIFHLLLNVLTAIFSIFFCRLGV